MSETHGEHTRHYVVCVSDARLAAHVCSRMHRTQPSVRLERLGPDSDITQAVRESLRARLRDSRRPRNGDDEYEEMPGRAATIVVNTTSRLFILKGGVPPPWTPFSTDIDGGAEDDQYDGDDKGVSAQKMSMTDVFMMPFERNLGVLLPQGILWEDPRMMAFDCMVLDPCDDTESFAGGAPLMS
jgi:hypothetical protein